MRGLLMGWLLLSLALASSAQTFTRITEGIEVNDPGDSRAVNWVDIDNDGDLDLYVTNGTQGGANNFLYRNDPGTFVKITDDPIVLAHLSSDGATWGDFDNDGDPDCFVANWYNQNNLLYANDGDGTFTQVTTGPVVSDHGYSESGSWVDYDADGWLDLMVANSAGNPHSNFLYHNNGNGTFTHITAGAIATDQGGSRAPMWCDYDNDGDQDCFVANEGSPQNDFLYRNDGGGNFTRITDGPVVTSGGVSMSASWGDYDNDGDFDLFVANAGTVQGSCNGVDFLFRNDGGGNFTRMTDSEVELHGGCSFGSLWADLDNDADLDLLVTNAWRTGGNVIFHYDNNGDGTFTFVTGDPLVTDTAWTYGCAAADYDRDGDLDVFAANWTPPTSLNRFYRNNAQDNYNHWLVLKLVGTTSNRSAIGTRVRVKTSFNSTPVWQIREVTGQSGYCGQTLEQHFGSGLADVVDSLEVRWPNGTVETYTAIPVNQFLTITEGGGIAGVGEHGMVPDAFGFREAYPNPFNPALELAYALPRAQNVSLKIFDVTGREIATLANGWQDAGTHRVKWQSQSAASGVYFARLSTAGLQDVIKLVKVE